MKVSSVTNITEFLHYIGSYGCVGFDLFDTLIHRSGLQKDEILTLSSSFAVGCLAKCEIPQVSPSQFLKLRRRQTAQLKQAANEPTEEPTLDEVFEHTFISLGVDANHAREISKSCVEHELTLELSSLAVFPDVRSALEKIQGMGKRIILVSDMYFAKAEIEKVLDVLNLKLFFDQIYVSSHYGVTKRSGVLFQQVLSEEKISGSELIFIGDNYHSDIVKARELGIVPVLKRNGQSPKFQPSQNWIDCVGDLATSFCMKVAIDGQRQGISRLYFLSRDGTVFFHIFEDLRQSNSAFASLTKDIEIKHLAINREGVIFLQRPASELNLETVFELFLGVHKDGFVLGELFEFLEMESFDSAVLDDPVISRELVKSTVARLREVEPKIAERIIVRAREQASKTLEYLRQEQVFDCEGAVGFVDIGYRGSIPRIIMEYVCDDTATNKLESSPLMVMLLCGGNGFAKISKRSDSHIEFASPLVSENSLSALQKLSFSWLEIFFQDPSKGKLLGYLNDATSLRPQFRESSITTGMQTKWVPALKTRIKNTPQLSIYFSKKERNESVKRFLSMMRKPSGELVELVEDVDFKVGANDQTKSIIDFDLTPWALFKPSTLKQYANNEIWIEGTLVARNSTWIRYLLVPLLTFYNFFNENFVSKSKQR